jgi:hypothetical protein
MTLPSFLQHLSMLGRSRLVRSTKRGWVRTCEIAPERHRLAEHGLAERRLQWKARLDRFDAQVRLLKGREQNS